MREVRHEIALGTDRDGNPVDFGVGFLVGILDRITFDGSLVKIIDWKTGRVPVSNIVEPFLAAHLAKSCLYPEAKEFEFAYVYVQLQRTESIKIRYKTARTIEITEGGITTTVSARGKDPLLKLILGYVDDIEASEPSPRPGPHCENWYGSPCRWMGNECPLAKFLPETYHWQEIEERITEKILSMPPEDRPGAAFLALLRGYPVEVSPEIASLAMAGRQQLLGGASRVLSLVKDWAKESQEKISIGDKRYGWRGEPQLDTPMVLESLLANLSFEDLARAVNISPTSIRRALPKSRFGDLAEQIIESCTIDEKEAWGLCRDADTK